MVTGTLGIRGGWLPHASRRRWAGLTLVEMALVLAIIGLMAALFLPISSGMREAQQTKETRAKLGAIEAALARYVMLNERLPCPANGALPDTDPQAGLELQGATNSGCQTIVLTHSVVPWRTLGLTAEDAEDAWGVRISYRPWMTNASPNRSLTLGSNFGFGSCLPLSLPFQTRSASGAGNTWANCLANQGHRVLPPPPGTSPLANPSQGTGAAYVLISHGPNRYGGYTSNGTLITGGPSSVERQNDNNLLIKDNTPGQGYYQGMPIPDFDDVVVWRTIMQVAVEAKKVQ